MTDSFGIRAADVFHEAGQVFDDLASDSPPNEVLVGLGRGAQRLLLKNEDDKFAALAGIVKWMVAEFQSVPTGHQDAPPASITKPVDADAAPPPLSTSGRRGAGPATFVFGALVGVVLSALAVSHLVGPSNRAESPSPSAVPVDATSPPLLDPPATHLPDSTATRQSGAQPVAFVTTNQHALIPESIEAASTIAGTLSIAPAEFQQQLMLNGQRLDLPESHFDLLSITRYADQDIVLVSMNCGGSACAFLDLAFVRVFKDRQPVIETLPEFQFPSDTIERVQRAISLRGNTVDVALGLRNGMHWLASIRPRDKLAMSAVSATIAPLSADDCRLAAEMLDTCTELRTPCEEASFRVFPANCPDAPMPLYRATNYLARHTTGLNLPAFAQACKSASELSMTPSPTFIESEICSGADPSQWTSEPTTTSSIGETAAAQ